MSDVVKKLYVDVQERYLAALGYQEVERRFDGFLGQQRKMADAAKLLADENEKAARRTAKAWTTAQEQQERAAYRTQQAQLRYEEIKAKAGEDAAKRYKLAWDEAYRQQKVAADRAAALQTAAADAQTRAVTSRQQASTLGRLATVGGAFNFLGNATIGAGVAGVGAGAYLISQGIGWQQFVQQNVANSPMTPNEQRAFQNLALQIAQKTGANPQDVFLALRYGSEMGLNPAQDRRFLTSALALGLPTGGSGAIPSSMMAMATVARNFPSLGNQPGAIGNMILAASQNAAGVNAAQFVSAIPQLLTVASHIGGANQFPEALAMVAALTRSGLNLDEANTQAYNFIAKLMKPSAATEKYIAELKKATGIDVSGDFGPQALKDKGILGIIEDLRSKNLGPGTLAHLFPYLRSFFPALGLTGNQYDSFLQVYGHISQAPSQNPLATNLHNYLGLDSTQIKILEENLHVLAIRLGVDLLPVFNTWLKDFEPLIKNATTWTEKNKDLIKTFVEMSPELIAAGVGLKAFAAGITLVEEAAAGDLAIQKLGMLLAGPGVGSLEGAAAAAAGDGGVGGLVTKLAGPGTDTLEGASTAAIGTAGSAALGGVGLLGLITVLGFLGVAATNAMKTVQLQTNGQPVDPRYAWAAKYNPTLYKEITQGGQIYPGGMTGEQMLAAMGGPAWGAGAAHVGIRGSALGNFAQPQNDYQNRNVATEYDPKLNSGYSQGTPALDAARASYYQHLLGTKGAIYDTDFLNTKKGSQPIRLPGSSKDIWTFLYYVFNFGYPGPPSDQTSKNGGIGALWRDPMGHKVLFWHMNPYKLGLKQGSKWPGGSTPMWSWEEDGVWHMCIVSGPEVRTDLQILTNPKLDAAYDRGYVGGGSSGPNATAAGNFALNASTIPTSILQYAPQIMQASAMTGVPPGVIAAYMYNEDPTGNMKAVSSAGAVGLMQILPTSKGGPYDALAAKVKAMGVDPKSALGQILMGALYIQQGESKYGTDWQKIYQYYYNPGAVPADYKNLAYGLANFGGSYTGPNTPPINYNGGGAKSGKNNPQTPYQWSEWWATRASGVSGKVDQLMRMIFGPNFDPSTFNPSQLNPQERAAVQNLLDTYFRDEFQSNRSIINSEFGLTSPRGRALEAANQAALNANLRNPWSFFQRNASTTGQTNVIPAYVAGQNKQLGYAEAQVKALEKVIAELRKLNANESRKIATLEKEVNYWKGQARKHGGKSDVTQRTGHDIGAPHAGVAGS